ncbi:sigma-70 family RNA polymerase sigma factor [Corynebacterium sp. TAE3-ERU12]|uniref:sigma-70 family RNA polymerase sigma factor n=1 Tax=Corynebacterium sp. TAE3-ERU12 TaxID=2849491 RepID=UPI001C47E171|nr:sigma-70 family RNA polymerase sigma factor [Corynebacterium sp. TAE3-ERU12]MBV7294334.1 sigma-70 family RNA polymerase sigma factor [Corynebacterium sp. TAE3-ERU12]
MNFAGGRAARVAQDSDQALLRAHIHGDSRAFSRLVDRHGAKLWRVARRACGSDAAAVEAVQEGLIRAHRNAHVYRAESSVLTWLHRIVVNAAATQVRTQARSWQDPMSNEIVADVAGRQGLADGPTTDTATSVVLAEALGRLSDTQREAIVAVDVAGIPVSDVARAMGVAPGTVKSRRARGREVLQQHFFAELRGAA